MMLCHKLVRPIVSRSILTRSVSYFELLGVEKSASELQIKQAFRKKALQLHPDLKEQHKLSVEEARRQFILVRNAYEVLIDPLQKAKYVESLRKPKRSHTHYSPNNDSAEDYQARYSHHYYDDTVDSHGFAQRRRRGRKLSDGFAYSTWQSLADELDDALKKAQDGPEHMPLDTQGFPEHMETEELKSMESLHRDAVCMYITFGKRVLGHIVYVPELHPYDMPHDLQQVRTDDSCRLETLSLYWNNELHTSACRSQGFLDDVYMKFYTHTSTSTSSASTSLQNDASHRHMYSSSLSACLHKPSVDKGEILRNIQDNTEHLVMRKYFPGVEYLYMYNTLGKYLEYHCSRAWLPMSWLWPIPPRDERYDAGGWYIQSNKGGKYSRKYRNIRPSRPETKDGYIEGHEGGIEGSIPLLMCAFSSIDRMKKTKKPWWRQHTGL